MSIIKYIIPAYFILINIVAFILYGVDKKKAEKGLWRIPEATLFLFCILGGPLGGLLGMKVFHHKTKKWYFAIFVPVILILWIVAVAYFIIK